MLTAMHEKMDGRYSRFKMIDEIDAEALRRAREIFINYKRRGIIVNESFDDVTWKISNQTRNFGLYMLDFEEHCHKNIMEWIGCDYYCYQNCIKAYIAFNFGKLGGSTLQNIVDIFDKLSLKTMDETIDSNKYINHIVEFLKIIPDGNEERDYVIESLEEKMTQNNWHKRGGSQRHLADFKTYLKFDEALGKFWTTANQNQKLFYFPLYFWWNLTAILPLRPMEFLLTPRNCLESNENILTVRRTKLKGGIEKVTYRINGDYECKQYTLQAKLADELRSYLKSTDKMEQTEINTLFLQKPHFEYIGRNGHIHNRYYTRGNLETCMKYFYKEADLKFNRVHLGDTRHLAMTNLIMSGGSPTVCKELAGHADINISSHYYSNISNLVECVTLEKYRKSKNGSTEMIGIHKYSLTLPEVRYRLPKGWCDVPTIKDGDISECLKSTDGKGRIGNCTNCIHYWPDEQGIRLKFFDEHVGKQAVDIDSQYLIQMIDLVRKGLGYTENIKSALLRLQHSSNHYGNCLWEKYMKEDSKSWQDREN